MKKLFKIFGGDDRPTVNTVRRPITEIIQEEFDTEMAGIMSELRIRPELERIGSKLEARHEALKALGFINTPDVLEVERLEKENADRIKQMADNDEILKGIEVMSMKYPTLKVITLDTLKKVCKKYGLAYGAARCYTGSIPQKNIDDMLRAKIEKNDRALLNELEFYAKELAETTIERAEKELRFAPSQEYMKKHYDEHSLAWAPLVIAAPSKYFKDLVGVRDDGAASFVTARDEDPIVMQPVSYKDRVYMLVITAWGPEASDPDIVNERFN